MVHSKLLRVEARSVTLDDMCHCPELLLTVQALVELKNAFTSLKIFEGLDFLEESFACISRDPGLDVVSHDEIWIRANNVVFCAL